MDDDGLLDVDQLPDALRTLYFERREDRTPLRLWTEKLQETLALEGQKEQSQ